MNLRDAFEPPVPAIVLAEGAFGAPGGKTANGVVLHSEIFEPQVVVDAESAGRSARETLGNPDTPPVPVVESIDQALALAPDADALVIGVAPAGGELPDDWVPGIEAAIRAGCDVVSGLHVFLSTIDRWQRLAETHDVRLLDVRKPPAEDALRVGDGDPDVDATVVLTLGTDCAVGKRTTTFELYRAARAAGVDAGWVATGQTGIMVGAHEGVVIDRVPSDFAAGVTEAMVRSVAASHDFVFVEGQAALTHRAYAGVALSILHGASPDGVVLADDPNRDRRAHFETFEVAGVAHERAVIEQLSDADVVALSTWGVPELEAARHDLPAANVYNADGAAALFETVRTALSPHLTAE